MKIKSLETRIIAKYVNESKFELKLCCVLIFVTTSSNLTPTQQRYFQQTRSYITLMMTEIKSNRKKKLSIIDKSTVSRIYFIYMKLHLNCVFFIV